MQDNWYVVNMIQSMKLWRVGRQEHSICLLESIVHQEELPQEVERL